MESNGCFLWIPFFPEFELQDAKGDWVCLRFRRSALRKLGIVTKDEQVRCSWAVSSLQVLCEHG